jgi:hypothetical protein
MSNITNTCLYQSCTKIINIPSQDICMYHTMYQNSTIHQPVPQQVHHPCTNTCTKSCINHEPQLFQTVHQPCIPTMYINTILCTNHIPYHSIYQYTNKPRIAPTMYLNKYTTTIMYHASNDVPHVIYQKTQTYSSSMLLNITKMEPHNTIYQASSKHHNM